MAYKLPPISSLTQIDRKDQVVALGHLFEPCETLSEFIISRIAHQSFEDYQRLIEFVRIELVHFLQQAEAEANRSGTGVDPRISKIIAAHPRLGGSSKAPTGKLSEHSSKEQKSLQGSEEESKKLVYLNDLYEETFPGLRYVVFVNGRSREVVMKDMQERIDRGDIQKERRQAFEAMCDIALDRAGKLGAKQHL
ncbi:uncharacterized protein CANTADRAFT_111125 [Suhomyces tanzawaensis NRRL Y-17324]|uniref:Oxo-4-hydroxy-4-carboxy-5-ureidoimidazoline decarboxylase domain-containing protein n=1 Tax=Suhomyces tanzawaensis NRRL Y-17324 TaxID=984487 RepID=A0A1E4SPW6_9ASCO|nr:uncharacterized protein CANTADRAFT_111125 [Suhomyces tanzawaensis NRRL Y-17324]ODV81539.1 hypothetical protein CANTADRAFT_111125 [Suhomyces tanzawaensis NRRL Y-17324]